MTAKHSDITANSDINYSLYEIDVLILNGGEKRKFVFDPVNGKITVSAMFRFRTAGRGKNIMTLTDKNGKPAVSIWCEGVSILTWDGPVRKNVCRYLDDSWYSVWVSIDTLKNSYELCIDGEKLLSSA